ncbi:hypothetical protein GCM10008955_23150 [Deinococcus malanensis]|uniref:DUF4403 family protein n=1 Tax=Deinococcus malanensis TaxID=1706855 RepID=A0ABQ2EVU9_9DEIO|nr:DUF4403 family protein [Deinococcus malanensis]GGK28798.1 hypothetical protein GCM10008955_23150 [Deinococcus malanensis]
MSAPAEAVSTLNVPVSVPLSGVQKAANARVPAEFARVNETRSFLGGLVSVALRGTVTRTGHVRVSPSQDGQSLLIRVPIRAAFRAEPGGAGSVLARDFGGEATVSLTVTPFVQPDWEAGVKVSGDYAWTDPLSVDLGGGVRVSVQSLVDSQVRAQLAKVTAEVERAVREGADLKDRAGVLWVRAQQPWTLPTPESAYALVQPRTLSVTPFRFTPDALKVTLGAAFDLKAGLGRAPAVTARPLPALNVASTLTDRVDLSVPVRLPYPELSAAATKYAATQTFPLPVPTSPTLRITGVSVKPAGSALGVTVAVRVDGPLGLRVPATVDVTGTPVLGPGGRIVTLRNVTVRTRREGLTGRVIGWLADARAQAFVSRMARFDLGPKLTQAQAQLQGRLPYSPTPGVTLSGKVGTLQLTGLQVRPDALAVTAAATGSLKAALNASALGQGR